jgi:hypothetical protein
MERETYNCKTPLIQGFFALENTKFWYLNFIYNFMYKCLDMSKIHFVEGDTDSVYWAVSGSEDDIYEQGFKHVIKDHDLYNANIYKYTPTLLITAILLLIMKQKEWLSIKNFLD